MKIANIIDKTPHILKDELFTTLVKNNNFTIERIVSQGHITPSNKWYDSAKNEWVIVIKGEGKILFDDNSDEIVMKKGDYINIPPHKRHRVTYTSPSENTIWLAVHY